MTTLLLQPKKIYGMLKETASQWVDDKSLKLGAALSYYTVFSLPPLLLIVIAVAGLAFGEEAARGQIVGQFEGLIGKESASVVQTMIAKAANPQKGTIATINRSYCSARGCIGRVHRTAGFPEHGLEGEAQTPGRP
jgi:membrane protein